LHSGNEDLPSGHIEQSNLTPVVLAAIEDKPKSRSPILFGVLLCDILPYQLGELGRASLAEAAKTATPSTDGLVVARFTLL
jgi:hypothetical protein